MSISICSDFPNLGAFWLMFKQTANMFNQLDSLGMPAAGIKQLDFPGEINSMFQDMFAPSQKDTSQDEIGAQDVPVAKKPNVRVYGCEEDM